MDTRIDADRLRDRFRGCMVGLAVGDALGMPVETMTPAEIRQATNGHGVTGYLAPLQKRFHSTARLAPGQWTDDTQLALAIARSLVRKHGFDLANIAAEHVREYHKVRRGWGGSTKRGIAELAEGKRKPGEPVLDLKAHGMGNGVAMKIAPLALFTALQPGPITDDMFDAHRDYLWYTVGFDARIRELSGLTHRDACARIGAHLVALAIHEALTHGSVHPSFAYDASGVIGRVVVPSESSSCTTHERTLYTSVQRIAAYHLEIALRRQHPRPKPGKRAWVERLPEPFRSEIRSLYESLQGPLASKENTSTVRQALAKNSSSVLESVPFVFATALMHFASLRDGVLAAVNAGGDTDSNAAIVGAMLGAYHGLAAIPREWVDGLEAHDEIISLADQLFDLVCSRK